VRSVSTGRHSACHGEAHTVVLRKGRRVNDRDERLVAAAEAQAVAARQLTEALAAPERRLREQQRNAAFPAPRRLFAGRTGAVTLLRAIPGFCALWEEVVPEASLREAMGRDGDTWRLVACPCGEHPALVSGALAECDCGRWYFSTGRTVRVKRFEEAAA